MNRAFMILLAASVLSACQGGAAVLTGADPSTTSSSSQRERISLAPVALRGFGQRSSAARVGSWMNPDAKKKTLVYVTDPIDWTVGVYDYRTGKQVGMLSTGLDHPQGICADNAGNIWVANSGAYNMLKFPKGATKPIATLDDNSYEPVSCSVNPTNGDLAVGNILYFREGIEGNVTVFKGAAGTGTLYGDNAFYSYYFVGYDDKGNLFFDGTNSQPGTNGKFQFAELPSGANNAESITLTGGSVSFPGDVQWDGHEMTVGDQSNAVIYQISGDQIIGHTALTGSGDVAGYQIKGKTVLGADSGNDSVEFFHYPKGGKAFRAWTGLTQPAGVVVIK